MNQKLTTASLFACAMLGLAPLAAGAENGKTETVTLDSVPAAAKQAIEKQLDGATVTSIEIEKQDGKTIYDVEATKDGKQVEFEVAADGTVVEAKELTDKKDAKEEDDDDKDDKDDDKEEMEDGEEDNEEETITLDKAPPAVQEAVRRPLVRTSSRN